MAVDVSCLGTIGSLPPEVGPVQSDAQTALEARAVGDMELSIVLTDDAMIQQLNQEYRGIDSPTDVLSFGQQEMPGPGPRVLGDLIISLQTAQRQADERGHALATEVRILLVHGLLHLLGYDHETPQERAEMAAAETTLLAALPPGLEGSTTTGLVSL